MGGRRKEGRGSGDGRKGEEYGKEGGIRVGSMGGRREEGRGV